jgi:DNA helicase-2/ATP-dependent DNA helicase PcrA
MIGGKVSYSDELTTLLRRLNEHQLEVAAIGSGKACVVGVPGCIAGSARMRYEVTGQDSCKVQESSLSDLFYRFHAYKNYGPVLLESTSPQGVSTFHEILDVKYSGVRGCVRLVADDGSYIDCTMDHLFMLKGGDYKPAFMLKEYGAQVMKTEGRLVRIVDMLRVGGKDTFDIEMAGQHKNFAATGFVVHNSGKTGTIVARIARLVADGLDPKYILAMTFTKAAAMEMMMRLKGLGVDTARVGTIHSVSRSIIAESSSMLDHVRLDERNVLTFELHKVLSELRKAGKVPRKGVVFESVQRYIGACKATGVCHISGNPFFLNDRADEHLLRVAEKWTDRSGIWNPQALLNVYTEIERRRDHLGLMDYDDMLLWAWLILMSKEDERGKWRSKYSVVIVDECQDSNPVQWDVARLLVGLSSCVCSKDDLDFVPVEDEGMHNLMVAGDPSQSIYSWRNARPDLFIKYWKEQDVKSVVLPLNYRSNAHICGVSTGLVNGKEWHLGGVIRAAHDRGKEGVDGRDSSDGGACGVCGVNGDGEFRGVRVVHYDNVEQEAFNVVLKCVEIASGEEDSLRSCAVLARLKVSLDLAELECIRRRVRYIKMASGSFFESKETTDILAYLRVAAGFDDGGKWLRHIINRPFRYISNAFIGKAQTYAAANGVSLLAAMLGPLSKTISGRQRRALEDLAVLLTDLNKLVVKSEEYLARLEGGAKGACGEGAERGVEGSVEGGAEAYGPHEGIGLMLRKTDYLDSIRRDAGYVRFDESKETAIAALHRISSQFMSYKEFLGYVDQVIVAVKQAKKAGLRLSEGSGEDALVLSTIHSVKGLEMPYVFIVDTTEGTFPCSKAESLDEELRLFFVAMTRAERVCEISWSGPEKHASIFVKRAEGLIYGMEESESSKKETELIKKDGALIRGSGIHNF